MSPCHHWGQIVVLFPGSSHTKEVLVMESIVYFFSSNVFRFELGNGGIR